MLSFQKQKKLEQWSSKYLQSRRAKKATALLIQEGPKMVENPFQPGLREKLRNEKAKDNHNQPGSAIFDTYVGRDQYIFNYLVIICTCINLNLNFPHIGLLGFCIQISRLEITFFVVPRIQETGKYLFILNSIEVFPAQICHCNYVSQNHMLGFVTADKVWNISIYSAIINVPHSYL